MWGRLLQVIRAHDPCIKGPLSFRGIVQPWLISCFLACLKVPLISAPARQMRWWMMRVPLLLRMCPCVCVCVCWCRRGQIERRAYKLYVAVVFFLLRDLTPREWLCWLAWPCNAHRAMLVIANEDEVNPIHRFRPVLQAYVSDYRYHNTIVVFQVWND